jgi:hypothetical protein
MKYTPTKVHLAINTEKNGFMFGGVFLRIRSDNKLNDKNAGCSFANNGSHYNV